MRRPTDAERKEVMNIYYIRWPVGPVHTLACAESLSELWDLLDEEADPLGARLRLCIGHRLAIDIRQISEVPDKLEVELGYESTNVLLLECMALEDDELIDGQTFFEDVPNPLFPPEFADEELAVRRKARKETD